MTRPGEGQVLLVNFWTSRCNPCRHEAPTPAQYGAEAQLVAVAVIDLGRDAQRFARECGSTFPTLYDERGRVAPADRVAGVPTTSVLDRQGRIAMVLRGPQTLRDLCAPAAAGAAEVS